MEADGAVLFSSYRCTPTWSVKVKEF